LRNVQKSGTRPASSPNEERIVQLLIERVMVSETGAEVIMRSDGLHSLVDDLHDTEGEPIGGQGNETKI
jgi:hypothetical protein